MTFYASDGERERSLALTHKACLSGERIHVTAELVGDESETVKAVADVSGRDVHTRLNTYIEGHTIGVKLVSNYWL